MTNHYVDDFGHEHGKACEVCGATDVYSHSEACEQEQADAADSAGFAEPGGVTSDELATLIDEDELPAARED